MSESSALEELVASSATSFSSQLAVRPSVSELMAALSRSCSFSVSIFRNSSFVTSLSGDDAFCFSVALFVTVRAWDEMGEA